MIMSIAFFGYVSGVTSEGEKSWDWPEKFSKALADSLPVADVSMANGNACGVLEYLGYEPEQEPPLVDEFIHNVTQVRGRLALEDETPTVNYLRRRMTQLISLAKFAKGTGATHIGWG